MTADDAEPAAPRQPARGRQTASRHGSAPGRWAARAGSAVVLVLASLVADGIAFGAKEACRAGAWNFGIEQYQAHCYTDIYPLYYAEGLSGGQVPYFDHHVEYPVIIGAVMQGAAWVVRSLPNPYSRGLQFFDVTVAFLALFLVAGVLATAYCAGPGRRWTALLVAFSPALILSAYINWDLIAMGLMMLALASWTARRLVLAGVLLGLAVATKFYPIVVLWPLFLLCLRAGRLRSFAVTTASAAAAWLVVNLPIAIAAPQGWATFYTFSSHRGADWGGIWYFFQYLHWPVVGTSSTLELNLLSVGAFAVACLAIGVLALGARRRPRLAQLVFLTTAAFLLCNKVWSPQYVVWLVPLVVLARPRLPGLPVVAGRRGRLLLRHLGLPDHCGRRPEGTGRDQQRAVLHGRARAFWHCPVAVRPGRQGVPAARQGCRAVCRGRRSRRRRARGRAGPASAAGRTAAAAGPRSACPLTRQVQHRQHHGQRRAHAEIGVPQPRPTLLEGGEGDPDREEDQQRAGARLEPR